MHSTKVLLYKKNTFTKNYAPPENTMEQIFLHEKIIWGIADKPDQKAVRLRTQAFI